MVLQTPIVLPYLQDDIPLLQPRVLLTGTSDRVSDLYKKPLLDYLFTAMNNLWSRNSISGCMQRL